jgi:DNA (cytosine-5)-methyltransferase 1
VDRVERFVVVHGQIVLNQFKHYPNKAVQRAAFVGELKGRMEQRKHHKLYMAKVCVCDPAVWYQQGCQHWLAGVG